MKVYNDSKREHILIGVLIGVVLAVAAYGVAYLIPVN